MTVARFMLAWLAALALAAAGCTSPSATDLQLAGAVYADQTPGYGAAALTASQDHTSYGPNGEPAAFTHSWTFRTNDPLDRVAAFYEREIPGAVRGALPDGRVTFRYVPDGARPGESVFVELAPHVIRITEDVRPEQP